MLVSKFETGSRHLKNQIATVPSKHHLKVVNKFIAINYKKFDHATDTKTKKTPNIENFASFASAIYAKKTINHFKKVADSAQNEGL